MRSSFPFMFIAAAFGIVSGCVSVPERVQVNSETPSGNFSMAGETAFNNTWWNQFDDPILTDLIVKALDANKSLEVASANVRIAENLAARQQLERSYSTGASAQAELGRAPRPGQDVGFSLSSGIGASWEIDLFDRIGAQIAATEFDIEAAQQARRDIGVVVAGNTALNYIQLRGAQRRLEVARQNAETQAQGLDLLNTLLENGRATRLDVERARALYRTTLASLPRFEASARTAMNALAALTGQAANNPDAMLIGLVEEAGDIPEHRGLIAAGTLEDMIRRRPDIRRAEALIGRQLALSEATRADLFPTVSLNLDLSSIFDDTNDVGDLTSLGFGFGPSIQWAGPDLRRVRADIDISDARAEAEIAAYEDTVITALSEVEIALTNYTQELARRADLQQAAASAKRALELASLRFEEGQDDFLDVLEAQRTVLDAEDRLAESRLQASVQAIAAYRALGGVGLLDEAESSTPEIILE
jgi:multidrug efflux system outer membrane protein